MKANRWNSRAAVLALLLPLLVAPMAAADVTAPRDEDRDITVAVCGVLETGHVTRHPIDDDISTRIHKQFVRLFDPLKLYFLEADAAEMRTFERQHDDNARQGDLQFPYLLYSRFRERLDQRTAWAHEFADAAHDFAKEETIVVDPETATFAKTEQEARERWRVRIKFELLNLIVDGEKEAEARERIHKRYRNISRRWHELTNDELLEYYLAAVSNSFDPHSAYMSARTLEDFNIGIQLSLEGIGALLRSDDGLTVVQEIVAGGAADKDGRLKPGDRIVGVGSGEKGEITDIVDMKLQDVVRLIRGKRGTVVRLEVKPANAENRVVYALTRQKIELQDRAAKGEIVETPPGPDGRAFKVGIIRLPSFYAEPGAFGRFGGKSATNDVRKAIDELQKQGVAGIVMDLRYNGGGLLSEAINLTGLFIDQGPVVQVKDFNGQVSQYEDESPGVVYSGPLVVLVSRLSASASEIFAGAIQDYGRGLVVGDSRTHGKGTVQKVLELGRRFAVLPKNSGALKLTMQQFYRVNGDSTQNRGVLSDVVLPAVTDHDDFSESKLDYALGFDQVPAAAFAKLHLVDPQVVKQIRERSYARQNSHEDLVELLKRKERMHERRARKAFTFSEEIVRKERADLKDEEKESPDLDQPGQKPKEEKFGSDPYTRETLAIMGDYLRLSGSAVTAR